MAGRPTDWMYHGFLKNVQRCLFELPKKHRYNMLWASMRSIRKSSSVN